MIIPTQCEIAVLKADENEEIEVFPGAEPINLAFEQCELNPAFVARIIHANFPIVISSYIFYFPISGDEIANNVFELENIPLKPNALKQYEGMERIWFSFKKEVRITLDNIWIPGDFHSSRQFISDKETVVEEKPRKQITPHAKFIAQQIQHGKVMLNSW